MSKRIYIIANTKAGSGHGKTRLDEVRTILGDYHLPFITRETEYPGHAIDIVKQIVSQEIDLNQTDLIVVGGDGTLHEVVRALIEQKLTNPITYIPAGTGNDFSRTWHTEKLTVKEMIDNYLFKRNLVAVPIFKTFNYGSNESDIILNSLGFGIDGTIMKGVKNIPESSFIKTFANGKFSYLVSTFKNVFQLDHFDVKVTVDGHQTMIKNCHLVSIMNSPFVGGGIKLSQEVQPLTHEISVVAFKDVKVKQLLQLLWKILITKENPSTDNVVHLKGQAINLVIDKNVDSQVDGELRRLFPTNVSVSLSQYPFYL